MEQDADNDDLRLRCCCLLCARHRSIGIVFSLRENALTVWRLLFWEYQEKQDDSGYTFQKQRCGEIRHGIPAHKRILQAACLFYEIIEKRYIGFFYDFIETSVRINDQINTARTACLQSDSQRSTRSTRKLQRPTPTGRDMDMIWRCMTSGKYTVPLNRTNPACCFST